MSRIPSAKPNQLQTEPEKRSRILAAGRFAFRVLIPLAICFAAIGVAKSGSDHNKKASEQMCHLHSTAGAIQPAGQQQVREEIGLPVGTRAPAFTLKDQDERDVSLQSLLKNGPVVLVFYRSADWCPYCKQQLVDLQRNLKEIEAGGAQLVGVSYDALSGLKRFANKRISFPLLSDPASQIIDAYGTRDKNVNDGVSHHATFIIDQKGVVRAKLYQVSYAERPAVDTLVKAIKEAGSL